MLNNTALEGANLIAERIRSNLEMAEFSYDDSMIPVTASLGIALFDNDESCESLVERADKAMYQAKKAGRNCIRVF